VKVTDGAVAVESGMSDGADCTISTSQEVFDKIIAGEQNPTSAYMTGKLKLKGDMGAAMKLQKLFRARRRSDLFRLADAAVADPFVDRVRRRVREVGVEEAEAAGRLPAAAARGRRSRLSRSHGRGAPAACRRDRFGCRSGCDLPNRRT
jgi:hypothetical protein